ncbi:MAG: hypothetical protein HKL95_01020 [Phycisphaerae bacterium]|nr:hypothetical protein [Phycisphaerae bacterium]
MAARYHCRSVYGKIDPMMDAQKLSSFRKIGLPIFMALLLALSLGCAYVLTKNRQADNAKQALAAMNKTIASVGFVSVAPASLHLSPALPLFVWQQGSPTNRRTIYRFVVALPGDANTAEVKMACRNLYQEVARQLPPLQWTNHNVEKIPHRPTLYWYSGVTPNQPGFLLLGAIRRGHKLQALCYTGTGPLTAPDNGFFLYLLGRLEKITH